MGYSGSGRLRAENAEGAWIVVFSWVFSCRFVLNGAVPDCLHVGDEPSLLPEPGELLGLGPVELEAAFREQGDVCVLLPVLPYGLPDCWGFLGGASLQVGRSDGESCWLRVVSSRGAVWWPSAAWL